MDKYNEDFPYSEEEYLGWKNARKLSEDDSKQAYVKWRVERDIRNKESSNRLTMLFEESDKRVKNMTPEETEALQKARKRHARKVRVEIQGYDKHPDEQKEDVFKDDKKENDKN